MDKEDEIPYLDQVHEIDKVYFKWFGEDQLDNQFKIRARYFEFKCSPKIDLYYDIWNEDKTEKSLRQFGTSIEEIYDIFNKLPLPITDELEAQFDQNLKCFHHDDFFAGNMPLITILLILRDGMKGVRAHEEVFEALGGPPAYRNIDVISKALKKNKPIKRSRNTDPVRFRYIRAVDLARIEWKYFKGKEAPKSISVVGSKFGNFLSEIFNALNIGADPRSAMKEWKKEIDRFGNLNGREM